MMTAFPQRTMLAQGQVLHAYASRGETLVATQGSICVRPAPAWLGEQRVDTQFLLGEGEAYVLQQGGWVQVCAVSKAEILCMQRVKPFRKPLVALMAFLASVLTRQRLLQRQQRH